MRLVSTRNPAQHATFSEALRSGLAPDGGLFAPEPMACFRDISRLLEMPFPERSLEIVHRLLGDEFSLADLEIAVLGALDFPLPLTRVSHRLFALELFHGPTLSWEDIGARFLANMLHLTEAKESPRLRTVLTATPGASGAALGHAFGAQRGVRAVVLFPKDRISETEARQIGTSGGNVLALEVDGTLEDCEALVRACREDRPLVEALDLRVVDPSQVAWILAQVLVHFEAVAQLRAQGIKDAPVIAVPCGDFGMLYAGLWAKAMGLPVKVFVAASNANRTVADFLDSGNYAPAPVERTLSPNLDVANPGNWERVSHFFQGSLPRMRGGLRWGHSDDPDTRKSMWELHQAGWMPEPHGAVAYGVLEERRALNEVGIFLAPLHPATSRNLLESRMNLAIELPPALAEIQATPLRIHSLGRDFAEFRALLLG